MLFLSALSWWQAVAVALACALAPLIAFPALLVGFVAKMWAQRRPPRGFPKRWSPPEEDVRQVSTADGVALQYRVVASGRKDAPIALLCAPLGQCGPSIYYPLMARFGDTFTYVTWEYRGLFASDAPRRGRRLSVHHHAEDAATVLAAACGSGARAAVAVGHSMGVQVALEFAALYPERVDRLVLLNGAHGQVFRSAFQLFFRAPFIGDVLRRLCMTLTKRPWVLKAARTATRPVLGGTLAFYGRIFGSPILRALLGDSYLRDFNDQYFGKICETDKSARNFIAMFLELDAHSVYHHLHRIQQPTLLVSGLWDTCTPAYHSFEMAKELPHARHHCDMWSGHATILEHPEAVVHAIDEFLKWQEEKHFVRLGSETFESQPAR